MDKFNEIIDCIIGCFGVFLCAVLVVLAICYFIIYIKEKISIKASSNCKRRKKPKLFIARSCDRFFSFTPQMIFIVEGKCRVGDFVLGQLPDGNLKLIHVSKPVSYDAFEKESRVFFEVKEEIC